MRLLSTWLYGFVFTIGQSPAFATSLGKTGCCEHPYQAVSMQLPVQSDGRRPFAASEPRQRRPSLKAGPRPCQPGGVS